MVVNKVDFWTNSEGLWFKCVCMERTQKLGFRITETKMREVLSQHEHKSVEEIFAEKKP